MNKENLQREIERYNLSPIFDNIGEKNIEKKEKNIANLVDELFNENNSKLYSPPQRKPFIQKIGTEEDIY